MNDYEYCTPRRDETHFTNLPLLTVLHQWFSENEIFIDINPAVVVYIVFISIITWILFKICLRILRLLIRPLLFFGTLWALLTVVLYTKQYSHSENPLDFVLNVIGNALYFITNLLGRILNAAFKLHDEL